MIYIQPHTAPTVEAAHDAQLLAGLEIVSLCFIKLYLLSDGDYNLYIYIYYNIYIYVI